MSQPESPIPEPPETGGLGLRERGAAVETIARAFRDNPLNVAVIGDPPERRGTEAVQVQHPGIGTTDPAQDRECWSAGYYRQG